MIRKGLFLFSPITVLTITWVIVFSLYFANPFNLDPIRLYTWFVLGTGLLLIYLGFFTAKLLGQRFQVTTNLTEKDDFPFSVLQIKKLIIALTIISFVGVIVKMYMFILELPSPEMYLLNSADVRKIFIKVESGETGVNVPLYKFFSHVASLNFMTIIIAGALSNIKRIRMISVFPLFVSALYSILTLQRVYFIKHYILWLACSFLFIYFYPSAMQKEAFKSFIRKMMVFILIAAFFLFFVLVIRSIFDLGVTTDKIVNSFYFYIAGNVFSLDQYLTRDVSFLYGTSLFRSFTGWFVGFGLVEKTALIPPHYEFYRLYNTLGNTFSYIRIPYEDFGIIGVVIVSYLWGWTGYFAIINYLRKFSFTKLAFAAMIILSFFWSFYGFAWTHLTAIILMLFQLSIVDYIFLKKSS